MAHMSETVRTVALLVSACVQRIQVLSDNLSNTMLSRLPVDFELHQLKLYEPEAKSRKVVQVVSPPRYCNSGGCQPFSNVQCFNFDSRSGLWNVFSPSLDPTWRSVTRTIHSQHST